MSGTGIERLAELLGPSYGVPDYEPDWGFRLPDPWPAVMRIDVTPFGERGIELARISALATTRVHVTPGLLEWFADRTNTPVPPLGAHRLWPYPDERTYARVLITYATPVHEISQASLEAIIQNIGQQAAKSSIQLVQRFGAEVPSDY